MLITVCNSLPNARGMLTNTLKKLLKVVLFRACKWRSEIHDGNVGHPF